VVNALLQGLLNFLLYAGVPLNGFNSVSTATVFMCLNNKAEIRKTADSGDELCNVACSAAF